MYPRILRPSEAACRESRDPSPGKYVYVFFPLDTTRNSPKSDPPLILTYAKFGRFKTTRPKKAVGPIVPSTSACSVATFAVAAWACASKLSGLFATKGVFQLDRTRDN